MAFTEPVLTKRIALDPDTRKLHWYDDYVNTGGYVALVLAGFLWNAASNFVW